MQNIKYAKNICDLHSFPFYVNPPPPFRQHDATYLFFMAAKFRLLSVRDASIMPEQVNIFYLGHKYSN